MLIAFEDGSTVRELEVVIHDPDATVADLARALDPAHDGHDLVADGVRVAGERRLNRAGIAQGALVTLRDHEPAATADRAGRLVMVRVAGGLDAGRWATLGSGRFPIGRASGVLGLRDTTVSARHAVLDLGDDGRLTVDDAGSHNGTWIDGAQVATPTVLEPGAVLRLGASQLVTDRPVDDAPARPSRLSSTGTMPFNRPPRPAPAPDADPVEPPRAPEARTTPHPISVVSIVAPVVMGIVMIKAFGSLLFGVFALLSPVMLVGTAVENRRRGRRGGRRERARYERELADFRAALADRAATERERLADELPDPAEVARRATGPSTRLWERRPGHHDSLHLRAGVGPVAWAPPVASGDLRGLPADVRAAVVGASTIVDAPVLVDLSGGGVVGVVGARDAALAVARSLLIQATTHHGPADLGVAVLTCRERAGRWDWAKWLPHTLDPRASGQRLLAADRDGADRVLRGLLEREVAEAGQRRPGGQPELGPVTLLVLDDESLTEGRRSPARSVLRSDAVAGIVVAATEDRLPSVCTTVIELRDADGTVRVHHLASGDVVDGALAAGVTEATAQRVARALARFEDPELEVAGAGLPAAIGLLPLLGLDPPTADDLLERWAAAGDDPDLLAPLGVAEDGVLAVDLVRDGPHGLVAGTTGAGKSELLRSFVAGLAAGCSPDFLTFVLVDFKGGSAFDRCARLPHTVGLVTDLDAHLAARALRCLEAELRHRERVLREAGAADLAEYRRLPGPREPVPRLVVVVDEFATLKAELPSFVDSLVGVAQRGRSLGVHLVLATQRPSGAVSDHIRANTNLRIALRVQDAADSDDVIDRPDAAHIGRNQPGRALVRLGPGEIVPIQTALSTGVAAAGGHGAVEVRPFRFGSVAVQATTTGPHGAATDLERLVDAAVEAHRRSGRPAPRRPWPEPLPREVDLDALATPVPEGESFGAPGVVVPFALADDPDGQSQYPTGWEPAAGNLLLVGIPGSGTTTACASLVLALAALMSPDDLHVHALDFGAGELAPLAALSQVGSVVTAAEHERQARLVRWLRAELDRRRAGPGHSDDLARIVVVLDGLGGFRAEWEASLHGVHEDFQRVFADGPDVGIHTIVTADRTGAVPGWLHSIVRQRWLFRTSDPLELSAIGVRASEAPDLGPGGAIVTERLQHVQVGRPAGGLEPAVARLVKPRPVRRPPVRIEVLPMEVDPLDLVGSARIGGDPWQIPIGIGSRDLGTAVLTLYEGEHALVAGPSRSGRSTTLASIATVARAARPETHIVAVATGRSPLASLAALDRVIHPDALVGPLDEAAQRPGPVLLLVDDAELIDDPDGAIAALLAAPRPDLHLVVAGRNESLRSGYGHWTRAIRASRTALLLQPDVDLDGDLAGATLPRRSIVALTPGRGYLLCAGEADVIQVAPLHESHRELP